MPNFDSTAICSTCVQSMNAPALAEIRPRFFLVMSKVVSLTIAANDDQANSAEGRLTRRREAYSPREREVK